MDVNLFLGATTLAATGFGIWGIVFHKKNGNGHPPVGEPAASQLEKLVQVLQPLATLPDRMNEVNEVTFQRLAELKEEAKAPEWSERLEYIEEQLQDPLPPAWPPELVPLFERIATRLEEPAVSPAWPPGLVVSLERVADKLDDLLQAPPQQSVELEKLVKQIRDLMEDIGRRRAKNEEEFLPGEGAKQPPAPASLQPNPVDTPPDTRNFRPAPRAPGPINLDIFNTLTLTQDLVYQLIPPESDIFRLNVANLGPGWLYLRANAEPAIGDEHSTMLPPGAVDNDIHVPGHLYVLASADGTIMVRLNL